MFRQPAARLNFRATFRTALQMGFRLALVSTLVSPLACSKKENVSASSETPAPDAKEPASNLNLNLTEVILQRDTIRAGETIEIQVLTKNASGVKTSFKNVRAQFGLRGGTSLGTFGEIQAREGGVYVSEFTARRAGTPAELEVKINGEIPPGAAPKLTVVPGAMSLAQSMVTVSQPVVKAGAGTKVVFKALDSLGNQLSTGGLNVAFSITGGTSSGQFGAVTDHHDGTYSAEFTGLVAGGPSPVLAKVGGAEVSSPLPAVTVTAGPFSPLMTQIAIAQTNVRAGESTEVAITAKDAYGNRVNEGGHTFELALQNGTSTGAFGPIRDLQNGTYATIFTGWTAGTAARITAKSGGQTVGTSTEVTVTSGKFEPSKSHLACAASKITHGGSLVCTLTVKDQYDNLSAADKTPEFALKDGSSEGEFAPSQSPSPGVYTSVFHAKKEGTPAKVVANIDGTAATSSSPTIEVLFPSLKESSIAIDSDKVGSEKNTTVRFQARDASAQQIAAEGLRVDFAATGSGTSTIEIGAVQDRGGGLYIATLTGLRAGTPVLLTAKINDRAFDGIKPALAVSPGELTRLQIENAADGSGRAIGSQELQDGSSLSAYLIGRDAAGNFVANLKASVWKISDERYGTLSSGDGPSTEFFANRGATGEDGVKLRATYPGPPSMTAETSTIHVKNVPGTIPDLARWYRATSLMPEAKNGSDVGDSKASPWRDSAMAKPYDGWESNPQRRPRFLLKGISEKPSVRFCDSGSGCPDSSADRIRTDLNFDDVAPTEHDLTIIAVAARENGATNAILSSGEKKSGLFLGWTDEAVLKFGFGGKDGADVVSAAVPSYAETAWELVTAVYDRDEAMKRAPSLSLYRNAVLLPATEAAIEAASETGDESGDGNYGKGNDDKDDKINGHNGAAKPVGAAYLGYNSKALHLGDVLIYKRALSKDERCKVHTYLNEKYSLSISQPCP